MTVLALVNQGQSQGLILNLSVAPELADADVSARVRSRQESS